MDAVQKFADIIELAFAHLELLEVLPGWGIQLRSSNASLLSCASFALVLAHGVQSALWMGADVSSVGVGRASKQPEAGEGQHGYRHPLFKDNGTEQNRQKRYQKEEAELWPVHQ